MTIINADYRLMYLSTQEAIFQAIELTRCPTYASFATLPLKGRQSWQLRVYPDTCTIREERNAAGRLNFLSIATIVRVDARGGAIKPASSLVYRFFPPTFAANQFSEYRLLFPACKLVHPPSARASPPFHQLPRNADKFFPLSPFSFQHALSY